MSPRLRAAALSGAASLLAATGCVANGPDGGGQEVTKDTALKVARTGGEIAYTLTVMAPDACFRAGDAAPAKTDAGRLIVTRRLVREPGICAQVMTPVLFEGRLPLPEPVPAELVVNVVRETGGLAASHAAPIPD